MEISYNWEQKKGSSDVLITRKQLKNKYQKRFNISDQLWIEFEWNLPIFVLN